MGIPYINWNEVNPQINSLHDIFTRNRQMKMAEEDQKRQNDLLNIQKSAENREKERHQMALNDYARNIHLRNQDQSFLKQSMKDNGTVDMDKYAALHTDAGNSDVVMKIMENKLNIRNSMIDLDKGMRESKALESIRVAQKAGSLLMESNLPAEAFQQKLIEATIELNNEGIDVDFTKIKPNANGVATLQGMLLQGASVRDILDSFKSTEKDLKQPQFKDFHYIDKDTKKNMTVRGRFTGDKNDILNVPGSNPEIGYVMSGTPTIDKELVTDPKTKSKYDAYIKSMDIDFDLAKGADSVLQNIAFMKTALQSASFVPGKYKETITTLGSYLEPILPAPLYALYQKSLGDVSDMQTFIKATNQFVAAQMKTVGGTNPSNKDMELVKSYAAKLGDTPESLNVWLNYMQNEVQTKQLKASLWRENAADMDLANEASLKLNNMSKIGFHPDDAEKKTPIFFTQLYNNAVNKGYIIISEPVVDPETGITKIKPQKYEPTVQNVMHVWEKSFKLQY